MRYIDVFTAYDKYAKVEWLYYVYEYFDAITSNMDFFEPTTKFRLGRVCSADLYFANIAEIPLMCGDADKAFMSTYDEINKARVYKVGLLNFCRRVIFVSN